MDKRNGPWLHTRVLPLSSFCQWNSFSFCLVLSLFFLYHGLRLWRNGPVIHVIILVLTESYPRRSPPILVLRRLERAYLYDVVVMCLVLIG
jgi:hypothetical protein